MLRRLRFFSKDRSRRILNIAIPSGLNSLLDIINLSIDLLMIGVFGASAIVAVGVSLNFMLLIFAFTTIIFVGNSALVARFLGANDARSANEVALSLTFASFCLSLPLMVLGFFSYEIFFSWIGISNEAHEIGSAYLEIALFSVPLLLIKQVSISAFSAAGAAKFPFYIKVIITLINPFIKFILIFGFVLIPAFGVIGAAIGTLIINTLETLALFLLLLVYKNSPIALRGRINFNYIRRAFVVGIPSGAERFLTLFAILFMTKFVALYGTYDLAGYQIATRIEGFAFMPGFGFMIAAMALMGQNLGAKKPLEAKYSTLNTLLLGGIFMGLVGLIMSVFAPELAGFFTQDIEAISASASYLIPIGISQLPFAFICILDGALRGAGITKITLAINSVMIWGLRVLPCYFIATLGYAVEYIYLCICLETFLRAFVYWKIFQSGIWRKQKV
ncbi:MATE family efflux transporter [Helicobacter sp.]|uniref:MATE family efflux transporter n=1 Tax=Helicobacter sp. TaxID=218 RepID=UPI0025B81E12|nr:MATE family efflux transporter [Helicobacter sp.]MCI5968806.1 MATE family efflux transporter [Helicobacter sp.]MDY2584630.1 MATE family efflux transporter [Helicobacter sp.]